MPKDSLAIISLENFSVFKIPNVKSYKLGKDFSDFRLIARIFFEAKLVYIRFIGTHAEYDDIEDCSQI